MEASRSLTRDGPSTITPATPSPAMCWATSSAASGTWRGLNSQGELMKRILIYLAIAAFAQVSGALADATLDLNGHRLTCTLESPAIGNQRSEYDFFVSPRGEAIV